MPKYKQSRKCNIFFPMITYVNFNLNSIFQKTLFASDGKLISKTFLFLAIYGEIQKLNVALKLNLPNVK